MDELKKIIEESNNIVFFGGAGVSVASGIPDFRSKSGIYSRAPEYVLSHTFFKENPDEFAKFYKQNLVYLDAKPNACHKYLKILEDEGKLKAIITQNIDGLHQLAGSKNVIELHGTLQRHYCLKCGKKYTIYDMMKTKGINYCECGGIIRPEVTLYEEALPEKSINDALHFISTADVLIIGGTSLSVYPAASFIRYFKGRKMILINKTATDKDYLADLVIHDDLEKIFKELGNNGS